MDIAKYIGLFLLKNHYCYVHGLGNLELKKRPASYDGAALHASSYEVTVTPTGSIDDSLANFIATNEQISISKAANELRDYSTHARSELQAGNEVEIPYIGKFVEDNGKVFFVTDANFQYTPPAIPSLRTGRRVAEEAQTHTPTPSDSGRRQPSYTPPPQAPPPQPPMGSVTHSPLPMPDPKSGSLNWGRILMALLVLLIIIAGGVFGYRYYKSRHSSNENVNAPAYIDTTSQKQVVDTSTVKKDSTAASADSIQEFDMIIDSYSSKQKADKRASQMKTFGHPDVQVVQDSANYLIVIPVKCVAADTSRIMDSLSRNYNPGGVTIYR